jgi:myo-inositol-1(or 4)-monophosphatase
MPSPMPREILATLLPYLRAAAGYACEIQSQIRSQPEKEGTANFFASALSDADLSVQTLVEVALLAHFPTLHFFGEEHERSYNTAYFPGIEFPVAASEVGPRPAEPEFLITLDPIDGTRFYLDGHSNFQIILTILHPQHYEAVIAITPAEQTYLFALRGQGVYQAPLGADLAEAKPYRIPPAEPVVFLGFGMGEIAKALPREVHVIQVAQDYQPNHPIPNVSGILTGELAAVALAAGNWIDGGAIAFLAQTAGYIVSDLQGNPLPEPQTCRDRRFSGIIIAADEEWHQLLLAAVRSVNNPPQASSNKSIT